MTIIATVVFALFIGLSARIIFPGRQKPIVWPADEPFTATERKVIWLEGLWYVVAAGIAGSIATALGPVINMEHNYWAMVAAVVPLVGHSTSYRVSRGFQRIIGTFFGVGLMSLLLLIDLEPWLMIIIIAVLQCCAELFIARQYMLAAVVTTPLALLATLLATSGTGGEPDKLQLLTDRTIETVIGSMVGMICVLIPWAWRKWVLGRVQPTRAIDLTDIPEE